MKKWAAFLALAGIVAGAYGLWRAPLKSLPQESSTPEATAPAAPSAPPSSPKAASIPPLTGALLDEASQAAVSRCLGKPARSWKELDLAFDELATAPPRYLWKVASVEEEGSELRLRLEEKGIANNRPTYDLRLFSVDEEGLPDPLPARPGQKENPEAWFETFLNGKPVLHQASREALALPGGRKAEREKAEGMLEEVQITGGGLELNCALRAEEPGCTCHRGSE